MEASENSNGAFESLYHKDFMNLLKDNPYYINCDNSNWHWEIPVPNNFPYIVEEVEGMPEASGIPMDKLWELLMSISEDEYTFNKVEVEGVGTIYIQKSPLDERAPKNEDAPSIEGVVRKSNEAPTSIPTNPHDWMTDKEIHEEIFLGSRHCSYCDYTPCRCKKEEYGK